jgi:hypothetical protein
VRLEVLHVPDCPNLPPMLARLEEVTDLPVVTRIVASEPEAAQLGMAGSPTLLIDGVDPFAASGACDYGVSCRLYRDPEGHLVAAPSVEQLRDAIGAASGPRDSTEALGTSRTRALPQNPVERAMHRTILRSFATTGRPPTATDLDPVTAGSGRTSAETLRALHNIDAIRLAPDGQIAVAYPFSATPTRHTVRIGDQVEVHAMCAIDALGISTMLDQDTLIWSVDVTTSQPVTVTTHHRQTTWEPTTAVVFIGADAGGGPSADCCCDYLNFFADQQAARAWASQHPGVPGHILNQSEAEELAVELFGHLLSKRTPRQLGGS